MENGIGQWRMVLVLVLENGIGSENGIGHSAFLLIMALACIGLVQIAFWPFATVVA